MLLRIQSTNLVVSGKQNTLPFWIHTYLLQNYVRILDIKYTTNYWLRAQQYQYIILLLLQISQTTIMHGIIGNQFQWSNIASSDSVMTVDNPEVLTTLSGSKASSNLSYKQCYVVQYYAHAHVYLVNIHQKNNRLTNIQTVARYKHNNELGILLYNTCWCIHI